MRAFTLLEMLVVLVILGIMASIALPAYDGHVRRARRAEARAALLQAAHRMEQHATATGAYPANELAQALPDVPSGTYRLSREPPSNETDAGIRFILRATPQGGQAQDPCGTFTLSSTGERGLLDNKAKVADCWNR